MRNKQLDGEIVAVDENGIPRFQLLQRFQKQPTAPTLYFVFDVLWANGADLTSKTLVERRAVLESISNPGRSRSLWLADLLKARENNNSSISSVQEQDPVDGRS